MFHSTNTTKGEKMFSVTVSAESLSELRQKLEKTLGAFSDTPKSSTSPKEKLVQAAKEVVKEVNKEPTKPELKIAPKQEPTIAESLDKTAKENPDLEVKTFDISEKLAAYEYPEVMEIFRAVLVKGRDHAVEILGKFGVKRFSDLPDEQLQDFAMACQALLDELE